MADGYPALRYMVAIPFLGLLAYVVAVWNVAPWAGLLHGATTCAIAWSGYRIRSAEPRALTDEEIRAPATFCRTWGDEPREPQEVCPACGHYGLHHYVLDRCYACSDWPRPMRPSDQAAP